jgi:hypothetical protein
MSMLAILQMRLAALSVRFRFPAMTSGSGWRAAAIGVAAVLVSSGLVSSVASPALALSSATRYAAPDGSGAACTKRLPCDIAQAVESAPSGAEVIVTPGTYGSPIAPISHSIYNEGPITVHGLAGKRAPTIVSSGDTVLTLQDAKVDRLHLVQVGDGEGLYLESSTANHMIVEGGGDQAACGIAGGTLFNSLCMSSGAAAVETLVGSESLAATVRNVTAIGTGDFTDGVSCNVIGTGGHCTMQLVNTIASGVHDVNAFAANGGTAHITAFNSAFDSVTHGGAGSGVASVDTDDSDIDTQPVFVDAANHNFHQAHGSPTIDAGLNAGADKSSDLDGLPRVLGKAVDIGAYEFAPRPAISKVEITKRTKHSLHMTAIVRTQRLPTAVRAVASHHQTSVSGKRKVLAGSKEAKAVKLVIKHLKAHTTYGVKVSGIGIGGKAAASVSGRTR